MQQQNYHWAKHPPMTIKTTSMLVLAASAAVLSVASAQPLPAEHPVIINLALNGTSYTTAEEIAALTCVGLFNRPERVGSGYYTLKSSDDLSWLQYVENISDPAPYLISVQELLQRCLPGSSGITTPARGILRYNATVQKVAVPAIITIAGVLNIVPLEDNMVPHQAGIPVLFDATEVLKNFTELEVTQYLFDNYANRTSTLSKMNPGYTNQTKDPSNPPLTGNPTTGLTDFIVQQRLFNFYLNNGCIPGTPEHALENRMSGSGNWPTPIRVYGYDNTWPVAGSLFEAETDCTKEHNMGQAASDGVNNLAYFNRKPHITQPLKQNNRGPKKVFNASKTYVSFVIGDGDNIAYIKGGRKDWMNERVKRCSAGGEKSCFPLLWSMSPHVLQVAPDWIHWYYAKAASTGFDWFTLPPSGDLYSYPSLFPSHVQDQYVSNTEEDCLLLDCSGSTTWEWFGTWKHAVDEFYPKYADKGIIRGLFPVNVPYLFPIEIFADGEDFKIFGGKTVMFAPNEYRGPACKPSNKQCQSTTSWAAQMNGYSRGTVAAFYITSDGGANLSDLYETVDQLDEHVEVLNDRDIVDMALQSKGFEP